MLISHKKKFVFVHIYKTAGTSVSRLFLPYARLSDRLAYDFWISVKLYAIIAKMMHWENVGMKHFTGYHKHASAVDIKAKMGAERYNSYFKFAFVRNPFDHTVSMFHYILQTPKHFLYESIKGKSFEQFLPIYLEMNPRRQVDFLFDPANGEQLVDFIGSLETIEDDICFVREKLSLDASAALPHANKSTKRAIRDYREYYNDLTKGLVTQYFAEDLDRFGYLY